MKTTEMAHGKWQMAKVGLCVVALAWLACGAALGSELVRNTTLSDGQQVYASDLHALVDTATVGPAFFNDQQIVTGLASGYDFLVLDPATQLFRRIAAQNVLYGNTNLWLNQLTSITMQSNAIVLFFDPTNGTIRSITLSNLFQTGASYLGVGNLRYADTNGYFLPSWSGAFSGLNTNQPAATVFWDTNGVPYQLSLSNMEAGIAADLGTNFGLPYVYNQLFAPWGWNTNWTGGTNAWGGTNTFPITSLFIGTNTAPTLVDGDTVPVAAAAQGTNTTATLESIYSYLTNKNALPAYTMARIQFCGYPALASAGYITITNDAVAATGLLHVNADVFTLQKPYAVAVITNGSQVQVNEFQTNVLFYAVPTVTNNTWVHVYTNYAAAVTGTNWLAVVSAGTGTANQMLYLTNYTSFNADVIPVVAGPTTVRPGVYEVNFRTPAATKWYYVTGNVMWPDSQANGYPPGTYDYSGMLNLSHDNVVTTNKFRVSVSLTYLDHYNADLVQVLVQPE